MKLTAKEIADDVQQTFEGVSCSYRQILEDRIIEYARQKCKEQRELCAEEFVIKPNPHLNFDKILNTEIPELKQNKQE